MTCYIIVDRWGRHLASRKVFTSRIDAENEIGNLYTSNDYDHFDIEEMSLVVPMLAEAKP